ncbi:MAG: glycosyltransferase family 39 protein [Candidatus Roizmanbacteria bacterium]|nr:glycosyltransferase family 39 protein [Candidatus Roizmanbacteria bacterium]
MFDIFKIFSFLKKTFSRKDVLLIVLLISLYFLTRLINLDKFPIFSDEGIYIRWAKVAWHDASWRFISLTDGKQPLQTWGTIPFLKLFPDNALLAGRLFAVATGFAAITGIFSILFFLFGKTSALIGSFLYIITPFFLFFDRIALIDSGVNAGFIWILFLTTVLAKNRKLETALILGFIGGFFLLAKSSVRIFLMLGVFAPLLFLAKDWKKLFKNALNFYFLFGLSLIIALVIYNVQRLSPFFHYVAQKNLTFVLSFDEFLKTPFKLFFNNISLTPLYIWWESGFVMPLLAIPGIIFLAKKDKKLAGYLFIWFILPFIAIVFFTKVLFPRYMIFFGSLFLILATYFLINISKKLRIFFITLIVITVAYFNYTIIFDYKNIPFPAVDRGQYLEGWPAGWGIKEFMDFARTQSQTKPVIIIAEGNFGMAADVLDVFLKRSDKITIKGYWPLSEVQLRENLPLLKDNYVYAFFSHQETFPDSWPLKHFKTITKPGNQSNFRIFELVSNR